MVWQLLRTGRGWTLGLIVALGYWDAVASARFGELSTAAAASPEDVATRRVADGQAVRQHAPSGSATVSPEAPAPPGTPLAATGRATHGGRSPAATKRCRVCHGRTGRGSARRRRIERRVSDRPADRAAAGQCRKPANRLGTGANPPGLGPTGPGQVLWLPSLHAGMNYDKHEGYIQQVTGQVIEVSRSGFFGGAGPGWSGLGRRRFPACMPTSK